VPLGEDVKTKLYFSWIYTFLVFRHIFFIGDKVPIYLNRFLKRVRIQPAIGFTLAELLIIVLILGEIAAFTIPKLIISQTNSQYNSQAKEAISTISQAYQLYTNSNGYSTSIAGNSLMIYMNYLSTQLSPNIDAPDGTTANCGGGLCYKLFNGGILRPRLCSFNGTSTTNAIQFNFDADGTSAITSNTVVIFLYYNGRVTTYGNILANTCDSCSCQNPTTAYDPSWFSW
jgi:type II secretory pathway pseudopilin PulG